MPRPLPLRLSSLVPLEVATEVCSLVADHAGLLLFSLSPHVEPPPLRVPELARGSNLGLTVQALTTYAQRGLPVWDWETPGEPLDALNTVCTALFSPAWRDDEYALPALNSDADQTNPVGLVLLAAWTRAQLDTRQAVHVRGLAALSELERKSIHRLAQHGEIEVEDGMASAKEAKRWLGARGVAGFRRYRGPMLRPTEPTPNSGRCVLWLSTSHTIDVIDRTGERRVKFLLDESSSEPATATHPVPRSVGAP